MQAIEAKSRAELARVNHGLTLSDQYWIRDEAAPCEWGAVNYFENAFTDDLGMVMLGQVENSGDWLGVRRLSDEQLLNPTGTTAGDLRKKWVILDGRRVLLKTGTFFNQEPYNEVIATRLYERVLQPGEYTPYRLYELDGKVYSACECMVGVDEELVPAWQVALYHKSNDEKAFVNFVSCCDALNMGDGVRGQLYKMIATDYLLANQDRHFNNFGFIRDVNTLEFKGLAPLYDAGRCLYIGDKALRTEYDLAYKTNSFRSNPEQQMELVQELGWFDPDKLADFGDVIREMLGASPMQEAPSRIEMICKGFAANLAKVAAKRR
jgi:hypothetical protein